MIEIFNVRPINKGNIVASCSVYVKPWDYDFHKVTIFQQGENKWVSFAREKYETKDGEIKYNDLGGFRDQQKTNRFRKQVVKAIEDYIAKNGALEPEDPIKDEPNPFDADWL